MSREDFRRELRDAFEGISGPPSPSLSSRVHDGLVKAPERRGPIWIAGLAAALIAAIVIGVLYIAGPLNHRQAFVPGGPGASPSATATPSATVTPSATSSPTASPSAVASGPAFQCGGTFALSGANPPQTAYVDAVRLGTHTGYDRITIEFQNGQPADITVQPQDGTKFTQGASGQQVTLQGTAGILVTIHGADEHTSYTGSIDFKTGYTGLIEARQVQDFEGVVQWGLGVTYKGCYRAFILTSPTRLVVDIQTG